MPELEQQIARWREQVRREFPHRPEIIDELEDHLRENVRLLIDQGASATEAVSRASCQIGSPESLSLQFQRLKPRPAIMKTVRLGHSVRVAATLIFAALLILQLPALCIGVLDLFRAATSPSGSSPLVAATTRMLLTTSLLTSLILVLLIMLGWPWRSEPVVKSRGGWPIKFLCLGLGVWVGFMVLRFGAIGLVMIQKGIGPWSPASDPAFFGSLLNALIVSYVIWLLWPWRGRRPSAAPNAAQ